MWLVNCVKRLLFPEDHSLAVVPESGVQVKRRDHTSSPAGDLTSVIIYEVLELSAIVVRSFFPSFSSISQFMGGVSSISCLQRMSMVRHNSADDARRTPTKLLG